MNQESTVDTIVFCLFIFHVTFSSQKRRDHNREAISPSPTLGEKQKNNLKNNGAFFLREYLSFHYSMFCSIELPWMAKTKLKSKTIFYSLLLNSKPDGVFYSGYTLYKE